MRINERLMWLAAAVAVYLLFFSGGTGGILPLPPAPVAKADGVVCVIVEDTVTPRQAETTAQLREHFDQTDIRLIVLDKDSADENEQRVADRYVAMAAGTPPPFALVFAGDELIHKQAFPDAAEPFIATVEAFGK